MCADFCRWSLTLFCVLIGVVFLFQRFFLVCSLFLLIFSLAAPQAYAARLHEIHDLQTQVIEENGRAVLRIEIGINREDVSYTVQKDPAKPKHLIVALQDAQIGAAPKDVTLDGALGRFMTLRPAGQRHVEIMVAFASDVDEQNYAVYTLPADRSAKKPYRLVIDVMTPVAAPVPEPLTADGIEGVAGHTIVLDPGHGGSDSGAVGPSGVREKDVALQVAKKVQRLLEGAGAHVVMTRTTDRDVYGPNATSGQELQARVDVAERTPGAELFLSIHCNAFSNPAANGTETYSYYDSVEGGRLAFLLQKELLEAGGLRDRGTKEANFYVLKHSSIPASLVELAFISNEREEALLTSDDFQDKMAFAIAKGLSRFFIGG